MIRLKFSTHAELRIVERALDVDHIKDAISNPDLRELLGEGKVRVLKQIGERRRIRVV